MTQQKETMRFIENFIIIWVNSKFDQRKKLNDNIQTSITKLRQIVNSIKLFNTYDACIDFIDNKIKEEKIFLIISGSLCQQLILQTVHNIKIDSIYIFSSNKSKYEQWIKNEQYPKVKNIFTNIQDICNQIKENIKQCEHESNSIQTLNLHTSKISNHLDASFMYSQLLKEIILNMEYDNMTFKQAKEDFVNFCQIHYEGNNIELSIIEEFKQNYKYPSPIWWYTRECFIYSMLNRALGTQDVEILMKMSFFICDLHRQLEYLHKSMNIHQTLIVYRGQGMLYAVFNRMRQNQGGLISFNNFLSTSTSKKVSLTFAEKALEKPEKLAILFEMKINSSISSVPFASLDKLSYFDENEHEILFSMHTVFRIDDIKSIDKKSKSRFWHVYLTLTNDDDEQLRQLTEHMRIDLSSYLDSALQINMDPTWRLSKLLVNMGEYEKALIIYKMILDKAIRENNLKLSQATHYQLGELFMLYKYDWKQARKHFKKMFSTMALDGNEVIDEARNDLTTVFSTIKNILDREQIDENEFHSNMVELLNKSITLYLNYSIKPLSPLDYRLIADRCNYVGWVRKNQGNLNESWNSHNQALKILHKHLPPTHPRLATTYNYIGLLHLAMNNHWNALDCFEKALYIQENALQPNHPHLAETHFYISSTYEYLNKINESLQHAKKAVDIARQAFLSSDDPNMKQFQEHFNKIQLLFQSYNELVL